MDKRPVLNKSISVKDFREFYWLREELIAFCREEGLSRQGGKIQIANRIEVYLRTGQKGTSTNRKKQTSTSNFDWSRENLTLDTTITDNYKNTENVRAFFQENIGIAFKFNIKFMNWMKNNTGKILADAINEWQKIELEKMRQGYRKEIAPQFEYNRYIRDFLEDNPDQTKANAIQHWKVKRSRRGDNIYRKSDLNLGQAIYEG